MQTRKATIKLKACSTVIAVILMAAMVMTGCGGNGNDGKKDTSSASKAVSSSSSADASVSASDAEDTAGENTTSVVGENITSVVGENDTSVSGTNETEITESSSSVTEERDPLLDVPVKSGEFKLEDCVKIGEYKGMELQRHVIEVTDQDVDDYITYQMYPVEISDENAELQEGDTANIDFVGKIDGEEFDGGSSTDYDLEIGSDSFIPGFEDALIGMKKGDTKDIDLTFPDDYTEELAGKPVVFTVTLNAIKQMPELNDEWVKTNSGTDAQTVEEYKEQIRKQLDEQNALDSENEMKGDAWMQLVEEAEILAFPEEYLQAQLDEMKDNFDKEVEMYETTKEQYLEEMGITEEEFESNLELSARQSVRNQLIGEAIAEAEGITEESDEYKKGIEIMEENFGMSEQEVRDEYGNQTADQYILLEAVMIRVIDEANITEVSGSEEPDETYGGDEIILDADDLSSSSLTFDVPDDVADSADNAGLEETESATSAE